MRESRLDHSARLGLQLLGAALALGLASQSLLSAGTVVLANRTTQSMTCRLATPQGEQSIQIAAGDVLPIATRTSLGIRFPASVQPYYTVDANAAYFLFPNPPNRVDLARIGFGGDATTSSIFESNLLAGDFAKNVPPKNQDPETRPPNAVTTIPVKILVDDEEAAARDVWERRLRDRIADASAIFEKHCFVRFEVIAVGTWESNDEITEFERSLIDFESSVSPGKARLAIGFSSQYRIKQGRTHLGGTRGPLYSHMLIREWSNRISEGERLEVLVHELGHFLGAVHSPEPDSVMRPVLGDKQARAAGFRIGFDPVNTLAMCLVSESMRTRPIKNFADMNLITQLELHKIYGELARIDPREPSAKQYVSILEESGIRPLVRGSALVVAGISMAATTNAELPAAADDPTAAIVREEGDALTDFYVRHAAGIAERLHQNIGPRAFLLGLGVGLDRTGALAQHRLIGPLSHRMEADADRKYRLEVLGVPTARGRHELARHFTLAAALTSVAGPEQAETACLALQLGTADKPGAFNPAMYAADLSGIVFAHRVLTGKLSLATLHGKFEITQHLPDVRGLPSSLSLSAFREHYGSVGDERFRALRADVGKRIAQLTKPSR